MAFPETRNSLLVGLAASDPEQRERASDLLIRAYRQPLLANLRIRWQLDDADAEDVLQDFFVTALEKEWLARYDPERARFRTFLRVLADRFARRQLEARTRQKRGGDFPHQSLEELAEAVASEDGEHERRFRAEWVRSIFSMALDALRAEANTTERQSHFALFERYDLADPPSDPPESYASLAEHFQLAPSQVINHLAWARRRFRHHVLSVMRTLAGSEAEYREDVRELLGWEGE